MGRQSGVVGMPTTKYFGEASFMQTTLRACVRFNKRRAKSREEKKGKEKRKIPTEILVHLKHNSDFINQVPSLGICESYNENAIKGFIRTDTVWRDNQYPRWYNRDVVRSYGKEHKDYTIIAIGSTGASYFVYPTVRLEIG
ncbi:hypothetical protein HZH68_007197 [Vespula germanica]|uniref:Uncharacterized protein n=1 Tax=Vespula germanica TaxID=30212 RepID=A0A834K778_VESGE|nr:hypothetical protein HZH68_007197 [Vespula germanica]